MTTANCQRRLSFGSEHKRQKHRSAKEDCGVGGAQQQEGDTATMSKRRFHDDYEEDSIEIWEAIEEMQAEIQRLKGKRGTMKTGNMERS